MAPLDDGDGGRARDLFGVHLERFHWLLERLDCFDEDDLILLTSASPSTLEQWRKRGEGPAYIRAVNRFLYPRKAVVDWLQTRLRERKPGANPRDLL